MKRIGTFLMLAGAALWVLGFLAWMSRVRITIAPTAAKLYLLTLMALSGGLLLTAGAVVNRARRRDTGDIPDSQRHVERQ